MKKTAVILIFILLSVALVSCGQGDKEGIFVAEKVLPSVLELSCTFQASDSSASAIIVDERGYAVTNAHVVTSTTGRYTYTATSVKAKLYSSSELYDMEIVDYNTDMDIAVLKFTRNDLALTAADLPEDVTLKYGQTAYVIGNTEGYALSISKGIISAPLKKFNLNDNYIGEYIQTDAAISSGSSGGALITSKGEVVGMVTFRLKSSSSPYVSSGMGFAIPAKTFMSYFRSVLAENS